MEYKIIVIEEDGDLTFELESNEKNRIIFGRLDAGSGDGEFIAGSLEIYRDGALFSKTNTIRTVGTMGSYEVFEGLKEVFFAARQSNFLYDLLPSMFQKGDIILLKPHPEAETKFINNLINDAQHGGGYSCSAIVSTPTPA